MPPSLLDERSLRERIALLRSIYDRGRRRLSVLSGTASRRPDAVASVDDLSQVLTDIKQAEPLLRQLVDAWSACHGTLRQRLSADVDELRQCAASCLAIVSSVEQDYTQRRDDVTGRIDDGVTRNRAVRAYAHAMRQ